MAGENTRSTLVGLTMLAALGVLMYGIFMLGKSPNWGGLRPYTITLNTPNANGVTAGAKVDLNGVVVGEVKSVTLVTNDKGMLGVDVVLQIDGNVDVPASASATLGKQQLGTSYVSLAVGQARGPVLAKDDHAHLSAEPGDTGLIPQDVRNNLTTVTGQLGKVADDLHKLLAYHTPEEVAAAKSNPNVLDRPVENISTLVIRLNRTIDGVNKLVADTSVQDKIHAIIDNLASASAKLQSTMGNIDTLVSNADKTVGKFGVTADTASAALASTQKEIVSVSEKLRDTLGQIQTATRQISQGNGTTGKLIQDPRLYEGLVDLSKSLRGTVDDLDFLLKKWKDEGVNLKLK